MKNSKWYDFVQRRVRDRSILDDENKKFSGKKEEHREEISNAIAEYLNRGKDITHAVEDCVGKKEKKRKEKNPLDDTNKVYKPRKLIYEEYLASDNWKIDKRKEAMAHLGSKCEICKYDKNLNLHHNNYNNLLDEDVQKDLALVCWYCHMKFHKKVKSRELNDSPPEGINTCHMCCRLSICSFPTGHRDFHVCKRCCNIFKEKLRHKKINYEPGARKLRFKQKGAKKKKKRKTPKEASLPRRRRQPKNQPR